MGKSVASTVTTLRDLARIVSSSSPERLQRVRPRHTKPPPTSVVSARSETKARPIVKKPTMNINWDTQQQQRVPLSQVVSDCVQRWFQDTLREAKNGDKAMEVLVGQMYLSGYGVARDEKKVPFSVSVLVQWVFVVFHNDARDAIKFKFFV